LLVGSYTAVDLSNALGGPPIGESCVAKVYPGANWNPALRSPLKEPGVIAKEGDYLLVVNGKALRIPQNPEELFVNTVNQAVKLTLNSKPTMEGSHNIVVSPFPTEFGLHQLNWIESNRRKVEKLSGGRIGYVYLPNMGAEGLNEFVKQYFPQIRKEGIIFDVRYNGGAFVDQIIFERLRRVLAEMESSRNWNPTPNRPMFSTGAWRASPITTPLLTVTTSVTSLSLRCTSRGRWLVSEPGEGYAVYAVKFH